MSASGPSGPLVSKLIVSKNSFRNTIKKVATGKERVKGSFWMFQVAYSRRYMPCMTTRRERKMTSVLRKAMS